MKSWLITGASKGLGRAIAVAAMERGDRVAGLARDIAPLQDLRGTYGEAILPIRADVTRVADIDAAVRTILAAWTDIDILVNNAGIGSIGSVEETAEDEARGVFEANFFAPWHMVQALLPKMREQGSGHIVQISSVAGLASFPLIGFYNASKWALEGLSGALAEEVAPFGVKVTLVEPGAMRTDWPTNAMNHAANPLPVYDTARLERVNAMADEYSGQQSVDPERTALAVLRLVDLDRPPLRVIGGGGGLDLVMSQYEERMAEWSAWEVLSRSVDFP
jgi:NAD(P)-dependent dehydrogenase (short-subunit alcohol dehydrogenase family)